MSVQNPDCKSSCAPVYFQACGIMAAAVVLGVVYNQASPLGVRAPREEEKANPSAAHPFEISNAAPVTIRTGYVNQTPAMSLETAPVPPVQARPAPTPAGAAAPAVEQPVIPELKWPQVKTLLAAKQIVLVDARLKANYDIAHVPGAISLPATVPLQEFQAFATAYPKDTRFVVYCGSESCHMSHSVAENLVKICGYTNVSEMPGGFAEYLTAEPPAPKAAP